MASAAAAGQPSRVTGRVQCAGVWKQTTGGSSATVSSAMGRGVTDLLAFGDRVSLPAGGPQQQAIPEWHSKYAQAGSIRKVCLQTSAPSKG